MRNNVPLHIPIERKSEFVPDVSFLLALFCRVLRRVITPDLPHRKDDYPLFKRMLADIEHSIGAGKPLGDQHMQGPTLSYLPGVLRTYEDDILRAFYSLLYDIRAGLLSTVVTDDHTMRKVYGQLCNLFAERMMIEMSAKQLRGLDEDILRAWEISRSRHRSSLVVRGLTRRVLRSASKPGYLVMFDYSTPLRDCDTAYCIAGWYVALAMRWVFHLRGGQTFYVLPMTFLARLLHAANNPGCPSPYMGCAQITGERSVQRMCRRRRTWRRYLPKLISR